MNLSSLRHRYEIGEVLKTMGLNGFGAEIGVAYGENAEQILGRSELKRLFLVDPWAYVRGEDPLGYGDVIKDFRGCLRHCMRRLRRFGSRATYLRLPSSHASRIIRNGSLDFVYIDGNHMSPYIDEDLDRWFPKVRSGGIFGGHDYMVLRNTDYHCDVKTAVDKFSQQHSLTMHFADPQDSSWFTIKP